MAVSTIVPAEDLPETSQATGSVPADDFPDNLSTGISGSATGWQPALADTAAAIQKVTSPSIQALSSFPALQPFRSTTEPLTSLFPRSKGNPLSQAWESAKAFLELPTRLSQTMGAASGSISEELADYLGKKGWPSPLAGAFSMAAGAASDPRNFALAGAEAPNIADIGIEPNPLAQETAAQFAEAGITPTPAQLTQGRLAQMVETLGNRYPYSAQKFQDFYAQQMADLDNVRAKLMSTVGENEATKTVQDMMKQRIKSYLASANPEDAATLQDRFGDLDNYMKNEQAGQFSQGMLAAASKIARDKADQMYQNVPIQPNAPIATPQFAAQAKQFLDEELLADPVDRDKGWVNRLAAYSGTPTVPGIDLSEASSLSEASNLQKMIQAQMGNNESQMPFAGTQMTMKSLRDLRIKHDPGYLLGAAGQGDRFAGYAAKLRQALASDIQNGAESISPEAGQALSDANANYAQYKDMFNDPYIRGLLKSDPEDFITHAIRPDDISNIAKLKQVLGPDNFLPVKQNFLANMLVDKDGNLSPSGFINKVNKFGMPTLSTVFDPDELAEITNAQNLFSKMGAAEKATGNPSGTAGVLMAKQAILGAPSDALLTLFGGHVGFGIAVAKDIAKTYILPRLLAKAYLSEPVRDLMVNGLVAPDSAMTALGVMGKAAAAGANQTISATQGQTQSQGQGQ